MTSLTLTNLAVLVEPFVPSEVPTAFLRRCVSCEVQTVVLYIIEGGVVFPENIRGLNLTVVKLTTVQMTNLPL
jgi:hypothetical protein